MTQPFSILVLTPLSGRNAPLLPPFAIRDVTQTLDFITGTGAGGSVMGTWIREDVNGNLMDLTAPQFRKFQSTITCKDQDAPAMDGDAWLGTTCEVSCCAELRYHTGVGFPVRPAAGPTRMEGIFTYYNPLLIMMVVGFTSAVQERFHEYSWRMELREVSVP